MIDRRGPASADGRGQMLPDFVIGVAVFLLTVGFVLAYVPQMTAPYQGQATPVVAERIGGTLADDLLAERGAPSHLNATCLEDFFEGAASSDCPFDATEPVADRTGVSSRYSVNVSLQRNVSGGPSPEILCGNDGSIGACGTAPLAVGPSVPSNDASVATNRRAVTVDGNVSELEVNVW